MSRTRRALCIGINDYPGTGADLRGCVNDAGDWAQALGERGYEVKMLLDGDATGAAIRARVRELVESTMWGERAVITFSGHGTWMPDRDGDEADRRDEALCPADVYKRGPLVDDELFALFSGRVRGARLVMISDSCHSGSVNRFAAMTGDAPGKVRYLAPEVFLPEPRVAQARRVERARRTRLAASTRESALLMSGCRDTEYSYDAAFKGRPNGAFTRAAIDTLRYLSPASTFVDWHRAIGTLLPSAHYPQSPQLAAVGSQRSWEVL